MKNVKLRKILAVFCSLLISSLQFQSYVFANSVAKLTATLYGAELQRPKQQALAQSANNQSSTNTQQNSNSNTISDANNFKELNKNVDPRTGALSLTYDIGNISTIGFENPSVDLKLIYSSMSAIDRFGLGKGWSWNITYFDTKSSMMYLSNGSSYKLDLGRSTLKYYKLRDLIVSVNSNNIVLKYKDGKVETIDRINGNLQSITNSEGFSASFSYINSNNLEKISFKNEKSGEDIVSLLVSYFSNSQIQIKTNNGNGYSITQLQKSANKNTLDSISNPLNQKVSFSYNAETENDFPTDSLITKILYPTATSVTIKYLKGGLNTSRKGVSFPAVEKIETNFLSIAKDSSGLSSLSDSISYEYNQNISNYLGKGFSGYKEGEDALFQTPNTYTYTTIESKNAPNHSKLKIVRSYNHFHQILTEETKENDVTVKLKEFTYQDWSNKNFDSLSPSYNLPIQVKVTFVSANSKRNEITKYQYDDFGNVLQIIEPTGIIKSFQYLSNLQLKSDFTYLIEKEIVSSENDKKSILTEYAYENYTNNLGINKQRLKAKTYKASDSLCKISEVNCGKVIKTELMSYSTNFGSIKSLIKPFALPLYIKTYAGNNGSCKVSHKNISYQTENNQNILNQSFYNKNGVLLAKEMTKVNSFTKKEDEKTDVNGLQIKYQYDLLGRMTKEEIKPNALGSSLVTTYSYLLNDSSLGLGYGSSVVTYKNPNGYSGYTVYDSLGREIQLFNQAIDSSEMVLVKENSYFSDGTKNGETVFDTNSDATNYKLKKQFYYDFFGREKSIVLPSGESKVVNIDDAANTKESYVIAKNGQLSPIKIEYLDINYKPIKTELLDGSRNLFSRSYNKYDSFGNLIQTTDVKGYVVNYIYNSLNQKVQEIYKDGRVVQYEYDPLFSDKIVKKSVVSKDGKSYLLGSREFNSIGMLVSEKDGSGREIKYEYDLYGNLLIKTNRSGKVIKYTYNGFNKVSKTEVVGEGNKYLATFEYENNTLNIAKMNDNNGVTNYSYYANGKLKTIKYPDSKNINYEYTNQNLVKSMKDINGLNTKYYYDPLSAKLKQVSFEDKNGNVQNEEFSYDEFGRLKDKLMANSVQVNYEYNSMSLLSTMSYSSTKEHILSYNFEYNIDLNITSRIRLGSSSQQIEAKEKYTYDFMNNMSEYSCEGSSCPRDSSGNIIESEKYTFDSLNNIKTADIKFTINKNTFISYEYSAVDGIRLESYKISGIKNISGSFEYDADGNMIKDGEGNKLSYSPYHRLISYTDISNNTTYYNYNGAGEIVSQTDQSGNLTKFYYHGNKLLNETVNGNTISYMQVNGYIVGKNINSKFQFYILDQARSVIRIIENGSLLTDNFVYTPYGEQANIASEKSKSTETIGFNGDRTDRSSGYQFLGKGYRAYNPMLGRFMQYDVHSPYGKGGMNGYIFAENNPIMKFDPTGESSSNLVLGLGIGFAILGIIFSIVTLGTTLAPAIAGTAALTATDIAVSAASVAGLASSAIGMTGQIYGKKSQNAAEAGNKADADHYGQVSYILGWTGFALGMAASLTGAGLDIAALRAGNAAANAAEDVVSITAKAKLPSTFMDSYKSFVNHSALTITKKAAGYVSDAAWAGGKGFGEVARNYSKEGNKEKADYYGNISSNIFWISIGTGALSTSVSALRKPGDTVDFLNKIKTNNGQE